MKDVFQGIFVIWLFFRVKTGILRLKNGRFKDILAQKKVSNVVEDVLTFQLLNL